jgi:hypothetical protein
MVVWLPRLLETAKTRSILIPVLVTGSQSAQVLGLKEVSRVADATLLDPCDKHRDEGVPIIME